MTAINILVHGGGALMFTDALTSHEGVITWIGNKAILYPHFCAAAAVTGTTASAGIVQDYVGGGCTSYDGLVSTLEASVRLGLADYAETVQRDGDAPFDVHTVGWSDETGGFRAWTLSYSTGGAISVYESGPLVLQPGSPEVIAMLDQAGINPDEILELHLPDAIETMGRIMGTQRRYARGRNHAVGGFQQATLLTKGAIVTRIVDLWSSDQVGGRT